MNSNQRFSYNLSVLLESIRRIYELMHMPLLFNPVISMIVCIICDQTSFKVASTGGSLLNKMLSLNLASMTLFELSVSKYEMVIKSSQ